MQLDERLTHLGLIVIVREGGGRSIDAFVIILRSDGSRLKFNLERLKDPEVTDLFEVMIGDKFAALNLLEENIDNLTENIHGTLVNTASEVHDKARKKKKPWMTNVIQDLCDTRRILKKRRKEGPFTVHNYSQVSQVIRRKMKQAKENRITDRCNCCI